MTHRKRSRYYNLKQIVLAVTYFWLCAENIISLADAEADGPSNFIHAEGRKLILNGKPFILKGINFSNRYDSSIEPRHLLSSNHHSSIDYKKVSSFGMNTVRFAFNGEWYEKDKKNFFNWIDQNIQWANRAGIYLILDLHVPIGGFWLDPASEKVDFRIWNDPKIQKRNLEMWHAIAKRYRNEPQIAAYDVLNEPVTTDKDGSQWKNLAHLLVNKIRSVDKNHLIIIGRLYGTDRSYTVEGIKSQFLVKDNNIMYDFHFYAPIQYTHQYASWLPRPIEDGGFYPDENILIPTGSQKYITSLTQKIPHTLKLTKEWRKFSLKRLKIDNPEIRMGLPVLQVKGDVSGAVFFDDLEVMEYSHNREPNSIIKEPLSRLTVWDWWSWHHPHVGRNGTFRRIENDGVNDSYSLSISSVNGTDGYSGWSSDLHWFQVKQGRSYNMTGHVKATDPDVNAYFDIAFYGESPNGKKKAFLPRNREYLEWEFMKFFRFGIDNNVPISVMEFGLTHECFIKGGEKWVEDIIDIFLHHDVSFAYWDYHSDRMGVYYKESGKPPGNPNKILINTFQRKLLNSSSGKTRKTAGNYRYQSGIILRHP